MKQRTLWAGLTALGWMAATGNARAQVYLHTPAVDAYATHDPAGVTILPNGRELRPAGRHFPLERFPYGMAMSRDGSQLFVPSDGTGQIVTDWQSGRPKIVQVPLPKPAGKKFHLNAGGADFSPDGRLLYWSSGERGTIFVFDTASARMLAEISLNVETDRRKFEDSYAADVKVSEDGRHLYCADVTNFRLVVIDTGERRVVGSAAVGRYPYALAVSGSRVFLANIGLFEYSAVPPPTDKKSDRRGLTKPPFGYPSKAARDGVRVEGRKIRGLGDDNGPQSFSVTGVDVGKPQAPQVVSHWKTGLLIRAASDNGTTVGGSAPNYLAAAGGSLFVSNGNNDLIERIDLASGGVQAKQRIVPSPLVAGLRGVGPSGMAVSPDGSRLYVSESGINAIGVLDARTLEVVGHIPTAWYPYRLAISPDGRRIACISFKGFGNGPNAGKEIPKSEFLGMRGVLSIVDIPSGGELREMTGRVLESNGMVDRAADRAAMASPIIPGIAGRASEEIKHVVSPLRTAAASRLTTPAIRSQSSTRVAASRSITTSAVFAASIVSNACSLPRRATTLRTIFSGIPLGCTIRPSSHAPPSIRQLGMPHRCCILWLPLLAFLHSAAAQPFPILQDLTDRIGPRLTGSPQDARAAAWALETMRKIGLRNVHAENWQLPQGWRRGHARCRLVSPFPLDLIVTSYGWAGSTPQDAAEREVISLDSGNLSGELPKRAAWAGKVLLLSPKDPQHFDALQSLAQLPAFLSAAASAHAVAVLLRDRRPGAALTHTGPIGFPGRPTTLAVLDLAAEHESLLLRLLASGSPVRMNLDVRNEFLDGPIASANIAGEIPGAQHPEQIVLLGAHLDSWDLATGAIDDGFGVAAILGAAQSLLASAAKPDRTIRFVLFTGEEQGLLGSRAYTAAHRDELKNFVSALIVDWGYGPITKFLLHGHSEFAAPFEQFLPSLSAVAKVEAGPGYLTYTDAYAFLFAGVPAIVPFQNSPNHTAWGHSAADTLDKVDPEILARNSTLLALTARWLADSPARLGAIWTPERTAKELKSQQPALEHLGLWPFPVR